MQDMLLTANQYPHRRNLLTRFCRRIASYAPCLAMVRSPSPPLGISVIMRVKDEAAWIGPSIQSIMGIADEIIIVDNGSKDGTYKFLEDVVLREKGLVRLWRRPDLDHCALSNFALSQTRFRWVFRWDGDMVAHTNGAYPISHLRDRLLSLDHRRYYIVYLRHINLAGDLFHQDPKEMVHLEEYIHTFSEKARYVHPGRFEAVKFPKYYKPLFWYEPYSFHVNVKPAKRILLRYFWEDWMGLKDYKSFPALEDYVNANIETEFGTNLWEEAEKICCQRVYSNCIRYNPEIFGPYPDLLKPYLENPKYRLKYKDGKIVGRDEI